MATKYLSEKAMWSAWQTLRHKARCVMDPWWWQYVKKARLPKDVKLPAPWMSPAIDTEARILFASIDLMKSDHNGQMPTRSEVQKALRDADTAEHMRLADTPRFS